MRIADPGLSGNLFERAIAPVVVEQVGFPLQTPRPALHQHAAKAAELLIAAQLRQLVHIDVDITRYEQIHVAVAVVISPSRVQAQSSSANARFFGDIFKLAVPQVVVENVPAVAGKDRKSTRLNSSHT